MKNCGILSLLFAVAVTSAGCTEPKEISVAEVKNEKNSEHKHMQGEQHRDADRGHHQHRFADPEKLAGKWNVPERDRWQHPEEIISALALQTGSTVAEIGAGTGYMVAHLSRAVGENGVVIAIDSEEAMITYLTKRSEQLGPATVVPRRVSAMSPELQPASADGVITLDTWHHINSREEYARKVYVGLRNGGRFVVVESNVDAESGPPVEMRIEPDRVMKELEAGGFRVELARESMPRHYMIVGHKK